MAGKRVLFVAEKLTALEVVWDRLEKAGLGSVLLQSARTGIESECGQAVPGRESLDAATRLRSIAV